METGRHPLVLVTEINEIVGIDLCEALREAGYRVAGPVSTVADAEAFLARELPDFAVIEPYLKDGDCTGTMERLRQSGVPFLVHSVVKVDGTIAWDPSDTPWLVKPAVPWDVVIALDEMAIGNL